MYDSSVSGGPSDNVGSDTSKVEGLHIDFSFQIILLLSEFRLTSCDLTLLIMEGMLNKAKETIFKQYEEVLPRVAKSTSFYRPDVGTPQSRSTDIPNI